MKKTYKLENLCCANCAAKIESALNKLDSVESATVNFMTQKLILDAAEDALGPVLEQTQKIIKKYEPDCKLIL